MKSATYLTPHHDYFPLHNHLIGSLLQILLQGILVLTSVSYIYLYLPQRLVGMMENRLWGLSTLESVCNRALPTGNEIVRTLDDELPRTYQ